MKQNFKLTTALLVLTMTLANFNLAMGQNMSRWIDLTVQQGEQIKLKLKADAAATPVKVESGTYNNTFTVDTDWTNAKNHTAQAGRMRIYGDITGFDCYNNGSKLTGLDVSHNTALKELECDYNQLTTLDVSQNTALIRLACGDNQLTSLDVSQNTALRELTCGDNQLTSLDVSQNTALQYLYCDDNQLTTLDVSQNTALQYLYCDDNQLTTLDVSHNTALKKLWCFLNQLTALDVSHNTALKELHCYRNNFTTQAIDDIYCSLPQRQAADHARIYPLYNNTDANHALVLATRKQNAIDKGWKVWYKDTFTDIPATTGTYVCPPPVNMSRYIELTVQPGSSIWLNLMAEADDTPVKIVSGTTAIRFRASSEYWIESTYIAQAGTMRIYGDIAGFDCGDNEPDITGLDVSHNTALEHLSCYGNQLTTLDVSQNTALQYLYCDDNQLTTLDVSHNTALKELYCDGNNFTTQAIDDIYCSLPQRQPTDNAKIYPVDNPTDINLALVLATNKQNAINKGWKVLYRDDTDIPATTGVYKCETGIELVESSMTIYPNPAKDKLNIKSDIAVESLELYDALGRMVMRKNTVSDNASLDVSNLNNGIYILKLRTAGGIEEYKVAIE